MKKEYVPLIAINSFISIVVCCIFFFLLFHFKSTNFKNTPEQTGEKPYQSSRNQKLTDESFNQRLEAAEEKIASLEESRKYLVQADESKRPKGFIAGGLSYPSEGIPGALQACAENVNSGSLFCTQDKLKSTKYFFQTGYRLEVPEGDYYVYSMFNGGVVASYTKTIDPNGPFKHEKVLVHVKGNTTIDHIDLFDIE